jgi:Mn2+/Fe2+ NRAMP family transporter
LGPGLVTGAADDDPSGIATYSQAGAQFGYALTWTMFLTFPFMVAIQIISGCIGWKTRNGLASNIAHHLPRSVLYSVIVLLVVANTINIAADLAAMGEAVTLVVGGYSFVYALAFGIICAAAEIAIPYHRYANILKVTTLVLFVYVATAFTVKVPWGDVLWATLFPSMKMDRDLLLTTVAVFGTTISPYLFFWQSCQEAEESRFSYRRLQKESKTFLSDISVDTAAGMVLSNTVGFFIIVTTAATLHASGITKIQTAAQAAEALRPLAGELTFFLFALGIIGTGLLAVPVLAGSAAYAVAETFGFTGSLELPAGRAIGFYAVISAATLIGAVLAMTSIDPIALLFWTAVINGVVAVPIIFAMMMLVSRGGRNQIFEIPKLLLALGWLTGGIMTLTVALLAWQWST